MVKAFISYSHADVRYKDELEKHLATLRRNGEIESWTDTMISPSEVWNESISKSLNTADLIICLISADFLNSDYCYEIEMKDALVRHKEGKTQIIPIIIRSCDWSDTPFASIQVLPTLGKPIRDWPDQDQAYTNVIEGLKKSIRAISQPPGADARSAYDPHTDSRTPYIAPAAPRPAAYVEYTPNEEKHKQKTHSHKSGRKMAFIYVAIAVVILFVAIRIFLKNKPAEQAADQAVSKLSDEASVRSLTEYISDYSARQLAIVCLICAIAGKVVGDLVDSGFGLLVNILIGIVGGLLGMWLFSDYLSLTGNPWINDIITILVSALILMLPFKFIRSMFKP